MVENLYRRLIKFNWWNLDCVQSYLFQGFEFEAFLVKSDIENSSYFY